MVAPATAPPKATTNATAGETRRKSCTTTPISSSTTTRIRVATSTSACDWGALLGGAFGTSIATVTVGVASGLGIGLANPPGSVDAAGFAVFGSPAAGKRPPLDGDGAGETRPPVA